MSTSILSDPKLFVILFRIDSDLAEKARAERCPCGGRLDTADYPRKPRAPGDLGPEHRRRHSFSCAVCRRRTMSMIRVIEPASFRLTEPPCSPETPPSSVTDMGGPLGAATPRGGWRLRGRFHR